MEFSPTQHVYAKTAVLVGEMRASSQEMPERKGAPVRTGGPGGRSCEDPEFQRLKHRNGTMEQW